MSALDETSRKDAEAQSQVRLAPLAGVAQSGAGSLRFPASGAWAPGDWFTITSSAAFHMEMGGGAVVATTAEAGPLPFGVHDFVVPTGATHVAVIAASGSIDVTAWKS